MGKVEGGGRNPVNISHGQKFHFFTHRVKTLEFYPDASELYRGYYVGGDSIMRGSTFGKNGNVILKLGTPPKWITDVEVNHIVYDKRATIFIKLKFWLSKNANYTKTTVFKLLLQRCLSYEVYEKLDDWSIINDIWVCRSNCEVEVRL